MYFFFAFFGALKTYFFEVFELLIELLGGRYANDVPMIPGPHEQPLDYDRNTVMADDDDDGNDDYKDMLLDDDPGKILAEENGLNIYLPLAESQVEFIDFWLLGVVAFVTILSLVRLVRAMRNIKSKPKSEEQELDNEVFYDLSSTEDEDEMICYSDSEEDDVFLEFLEDEMISYSESDEDDVFLEFQLVENEGLTNLTDDVSLDYFEDEKDVLVDDLYSNILHDAPEDVIDLELSDGLENTNLEPFEEEAVPNFKPDDDEANQDVDLGEEEEASLDWESGEENGFPEVPSDLEWYPGLLFQEEERLLYLESVKNNFLELPFNEDSFSDWSPDYEDNPELVSDEVELRRYFQRKEERFPDSPSDDEEIFDTFPYNKDLPSEDEERFCSFSQYFQDY